MEILWKELPTEIIHKILKLTGKVVFRDGRYIDINKLKIIKNKNDIEDIYKKQLKFDITKSYDNKAWYLEFQFDKLAYDDPIEIRHHGLCFSYRFHYRDKFQVCYWNNRYPELGEGGVSWVQKRTYFDLKDCVIPKIN